MNSWQIKYTELFSLSIQQPFYENGICKKFISDPQPDILLIPTMECQALLKRLDLVFRPAPEKAGCVVLANTATNSAHETILRYATKEGEKLSFWMMLKNSELLNFDNLPLIREQNEIWYFSNQVSDAGAPRNDLHLSTDGAGADGPNDLVRTSSETYHYTHGSVVTPHSAFVKHLLTETLVPPKMIVNQSGRANISFDLSPIPQGKCKLIISGADADHFYYLGLSAPSVFGVIEISLSPTLDSNYRMLEAGNILTQFRPFYTIQFNNRSTRWRYTIVLEKNNPVYLAMQAMSPGAKATFIDHFRIVTNDTAITFTQSSANDSVFEFVSDNVIKLKEKYISSSLTGKGLCLTLKKNEGVSGEAVVKDFLPFPSNGMIDGTNDPTIYSDIFLTI